MAALFSNITSSLAGKAAAAGSYGYNTLTPALSEASKAALKRGQEHVVPALSSAAQNMRNIDVKQAGPAVVAAGSWMAAHPGQTALHAVSLSTLAFPGLIAGPLLWATGFAGTGVQGASAAAAYQASAGPMVAKGVFATLQSAGMGGYGVAAVHGATRVGAAVVGFLGVGAGVAAGAK